MFRLNMCIILLASMATTGCGDRTPDDVAASDVAVPDPAQEPLGMEGAEMNLPLPLRLAFMTGHVEAGLALYRAGEPRMAAKHLLHPVSETHAGERVGLDALGFDGALFTDVSDALDAGVAAADVEPQLLAAQANLTSVAARAGGDTREIIFFLMDTVVEEYAIGVRDGVVADMGEYQDAFGFTRVALSHAQTLPDDIRADVQTRLTTLLSAWPEAPVPPEKPTDVAAVVRLVQAVRDALAPQG
ncbi:MAG: hypothetical protein AAF004_15730 [Pseudomonadota bacterium]